MDTSSINTEYYKVFYYVGRLGSITAAAEALCISQPAVSQAVKQLEKALNSQLFIRTQKGVRLTAEGELLFPYVERGIENLLDGERMLRRLVDLDMGEVRIGASDMTLQSLPAPPPGAVPWPVSQYQGHGIQRPDAGDHPVPV